MPPDVGELGAWGRGPESESEDGCDTEPDSDTEDDELLSQRGRYPAGYPFLEDILASHGLDHRDGRSNDRLLSHESLLTNII